MVWRKRPHTPSWPRALRGGSRGSIYKKRSYAWFPGFLFGQLHWDVCGKCSWGTGLEPKCWRHKRGSNEATDGDGSDGFPHVKYSLKNECKTRQGHRWGMSRGKTLTRVAQRSRKITRWLIASWQREGPALSTTRELDIMNELLWDDSHKGGKYFTKLFDFSMPQIFPLWDGDKISSASWGGCEDKMTRPNKWETE